MALKKWPWAAESVPVQGVLAICEGVGGATRFWGIVIPPLLVIGWFALMALVIRRTSPDDRLVLGIVFAAAVAVGGLTFLFPGGVRHNGPYLDRFLLSLVVAGGLGAAVMAIRRELSLRVLGAAILGDVTVPGSLVLLLVWSLSLNGGCID